MALGPQACFVFLSRDRRTAAKTLTLAQCSWVISDGPKRDVLGFLLLGDPLSSPPPGLTSLIGMKPFHAHPHPCILRVGSWEDKDPTSNSRTAAASRGRGGSSHRADSVPVELQDLRCAVLKLLLPGQGRRQPPSVGLPCSQGDEDGTPRSQARGPRDGEDRHGILEVSGTSGSRGGPGTPCPRHPRPSDGDHRLHGVCGGLPAPPRSIPLGSGVGVGAWGRSPVCQPLSRSQDLLVKVVDERELPQATSPAPPRHQVLALIVHLIQGPPRRSVEILKPGGLLLMHMPTGLTEPRPPGNRPSALES